MPRKPRIDERTCTACAETFPETLEFFPPSAQCRGGINTRCRACVRKRAKASRSKKALIALAEKRCSKCGATFPCTDEHFHRSKLGAGGFYAWCKECVHAVSVAKWAKDGEAQKIDQKARREVRGHTWRATARTENWLTTILKQSKASARLKGIAFDLDEEHVRELLEKQGGRCYYFGCVIVPSPVKRHPARPSLDKLVPENGYVKGNVVLTCMAANLGRSNYPADAFLEFCAPIRAAFATLEQQAG